MDKHALWKWLILILLLTGSIIMVTPPSEKIRLGLDLKGGTSFAVKIDEARVRQQIRERGEELTDAEVDAEVRRVLDGAQSRALEVIRNRVDNLGIAEPIIYPGKDNRIIIQLPGIDARKRAEAEKSIQSLAFLEFRMVHPENDTLTDALFASNLAPEGYRIAAAGGETVYRRDNSFPETDRDAAYRERLGRFQVPGPGYEFLLQETEVDGQTVYRPYFVKRRRELSGDFLEDAAVDYRSLGDPVVKLQFDARGARKFANVTSDYAPGGPKNPNPESYRQLAIVLDGTLYSAPVIREAIYGGKAEISGRFTVPEATFLSNILRAGSLPAPVEIVEKRFVAPSLGSDSIRNGLRAIVLGGAGVLLFMGVYYLVAGVVADLALLLNMLLLPLGMVVAAGFLGIFASDAAGGGPIRLPVLTLPGIAGILLTIGMAVDANVLIFERIREESGSGKRLWTAITSGYDRAFVTIVDANLTTLLTGIILFIFGSGPIRGFSVTLCAGIVVSMFTALVVTKLIFGVIAEKTSVTQLRMLRLIKDTSIDFVSKRKAAAVASLLVIAVSWTLMTVRGMQRPDAVFGVDFTGGASVTFAFKERVPVAELRDRLQAAGLSEVHLQYQQDMETGGDRFLQIKVGEAPAGGLKPAEVVKATLAEAFPEAGFDVAQEDEVGAQIGRELKSRALWSIILALVGIILYISWRFELGFAVGAIVALAHDVLVTVGLFTACGSQISLPVVAALLTIVGYSVNDTIVVFDRIREDLRLIHGKSFKDICNLSINQTLSRTLLTSLTTLITLVMLVIFGGGAIFDFALALLIGVLVGTYSSVFVATPVVLLWYRDRRPAFATKGK
ncbi:MAG: protein translocase subunit SecD [Lentisphaerae bacterium]|nr:protein translocase subunit SecD [Lentisphaerota bacterium]